MSDHTAIEWTDSTWNPVTGCTKISQGCLNCYAERFAERFRGVKGHPFEQGFDLRLWPDRLSQPLLWKTSRRIFVNSMSDLFHEDIPLEFVGQVFEAMEKANWHTFQVLTKRPKNMRDFINSRYHTAKAPQHIFLGTSVENRSVLKRIDLLKEVRSPNRFLSCEPLLESLGKLNLTGIKWVIVGGESGPGFRPMERSWAREIRDQCTKRRVPFFFKQWGGIRPKSRGNVLDGRRWLQHPQPVET